MSANQFPSGCINLLPFDEIPAGWRFELLGNVCSIRRGASPRPAGDPKYFGGDIPWFRIGDATKTGSRYLSATEVHVNEVGAKHSVKIPSGSLIVANSGVSLGFAVITTIEGCIHDGWLLLDDCKNVDRDFLFYFVNCYTPQLREFAEGTTQPNLNTTIARRLLLPLPPIDEQQAIANTLSMLDDKIELNRQMSHTLEAMAQTIFKSWFVDFDPVAAKVDGRKPYGLNDETAALFPACYEESALGPIPKGWQISIVGKEYNITMGQSPPGETYNEIGAGLPFYQGRTDFCFRYPKRRIYCSAPTRIAEPGDTLVSVRAPVGDVNMAMEQCAIGRGVGAIRHKSRARSYTYYQMRGLRESFDVFEGDGTLFGSMNKDGFEGIRIVVPPLNVLNKYEDLVGPVDEYIENNEREAASLTDLRNNLLPKLLSGEIRLKQAEKIVEEVA